MLLSLPRRRFDEAAGRLGRELMNQVQHAKNRSTQMGERLSIHALDRSLGLGRERFLRAQNAHARGLGDLVQRRRDRFSAAAGRIRVKPLDVRLKQIHVAFDSVARQLDARFVDRVDGTRQRLERSGRLLASLSYQSVLTRGFAVVRDAKGQPLTGVGTIKAGAQISIQMRDGSLDAVAGRVTAEDAISAKRAPSRPESPKDSKARKSEQGSLF